MITNLTKHTYYKINNLKYLNLQKTQNFNFLSIQYCVCSYLYPRKTQKKI